ncbi:MAG: hypothetical protein KAW17_08045 [Candidatus Eisenbacteria sp.]|nr:hypothetical protein [Candidatus Eisenbacteria bacterium]
MGEKASRTESEFRLLPILVLVLGIILSGYQLLQVKNGVFYSGDGGLKYLMVEQFARGDVSAALHLEAPEWVEEIWDAGLYPFGPPYLYYSASGHIPVFPILFQILSVPFFALLGYKGLYVIPVVALWLLWWRFAATLRAIGVGGIAISFGLAALIFASPLTLYGAMFWEFTLAALLVFLGVEFTLRTAHHGFPVGRAILFGVLTSLSTWLRPEAFLVVLPLLVCLLVVYVRDRKREIPFFIAGSVAAIIALLVVNQILYGHPLSARSLQVLGSKSLGERAQTAIRLFWVLHLYLFSKFPVMFGFLLAIPFLLRSQKRSGVLILVGVAIFFFLAVPFILPNDGGKQWGPRYLLIAIPMIAAACAAQLDAIMEGGRLWMKAVCWVLFLALFGLGAVSNTYGGGRHLAKDYANRIYPALQELKHTDLEHIVVLDQTIALELATTHKRRIFLWARSQEDLQRTVALLRQNGVHEFLYLTLPGMIQKEGRVSWWDDDVGLYTLYLTSYGVHGGYEFFGAVVRGY